MRLWEQLYRFGTRGVRTNSKQPVTAMTLLRSRNSHAPRYSSIQGRQDRASGFGGLHEMTIGRRGIRAGGTQRHEGIHIQQIVHAKSGRISSTSLLLKTGASRLALSTGKPVKGQREYKLFASAYCVGSTRCFRLPLWHPANLRSEGQACGESD